MRLGIGQGRRRAKLVRFGLFEANLTAGELRKRGLRIRLQPQPFQALAVLIQRPGELVTRQELEQALWPDGTFVEFEHGVNTAIKKVRRALNDSADNPRFIETVPRRGYRFMGEAQLTNETARRWPPVWAMTLLGLIGSAAVLFIPIR